MILPRHRPGIGLAWSVAGSVASAWRRHGVGVAWRRRGLGVALECRRRGVGVASPWSVGVAWEWRRRGVGRAKRGAQPSVQRQGARPLTLLPKPQGGMLASTCGMWPRAIGCVWKGFNPFYPFQQTSHRPSEASPATCPNQGARPLAPNPKPETLTPNPKF